MASNSETLDISSIAVHPMPGATFTPGRGAATDQPANVASPKPASTPAGSVTAVSSTAPVAPAAPLAPLRSHIAPKRPVDSVANTPLSTAPITHFDGKMIQPVSPAETEDEQAKAHPAPGAPAVPAASAAPAPHAAVHPAPGLNHPGMSVAGVLPTPSRAPVEPGNHPTIANTARARIQNLPDALPIATSAAVATKPAGELVTDKQQLAGSAGEAFGVAKRALPSVLKPIFAVAGFVAIAVLLFKAPVIYTQLQYSLSDHNGAITTGETPSTEAAASAAVSPDPVISIPKISVNAPVVYEPSIEEAAIQKGLESGVVHYGNTALPGQPGNVAIFGHSSNDWWEPGNFKFVFVLLDKLVVGDQITINYQSVKYTYEVTATRVVEPTEVSVLNATADPTLTLITCSPPGTSLRRLVVTAKQIGPASSTPASSVAATSTPTQTNIPSSDAAGGLWEQIVAGWEGITHGFSSLFGADPAPAASPSPTASPGAGSIPAVK